MTKIAITGATGALGRLVISHLKKRVPSDHIIALARSASKAADLGVTVREGDYASPASLVPAFAGVETVLLISSNEMGQRISQHLSVIDAAKQAGVKRIVYTSLLHADRSPLMLAADHRATEIAIEASGLAYTILRNGWYTENYGSSIPGALAGGAFLGSAGDAKISSAGRTDYAESAAIVLSSSGHDGKTYELAGDSHYTLTDLAAEISRQSGKTIPYNNIPEAEYAAFLVKVGVPEGMAKAFAHFDVAASQGALFDESKQLSALIGHPTTPLATIVASSIPKK